MKIDHNKAFCFCGAFFCVSILLNCNFKPNGCFDINKNAYSLPIRSGPVSKLPWDNNKKLLNAKKKYKASVLMAAYKTVLLDPLPGEEYNVHLAARKLCGIVVKSGGVFSLNRRLGPYNSKRGYKKGPTYSGGRLIKTTGGGVCKIATALYNVTVLSNLPIVQRRSHAMPVSYVPYGQDATVFYGSKDFMFKNSKSFPILIWAQGIGDKLYIGFYGRQKPPKVVWHHKVLSVKKTRIIYKRNPKLKPGVKRIIVHGMDGKTVKSWVKIYYPNGKVQTKQMGIDRYKPLPYIIQRRK